MQRRDKILKPINTLIVLLVMGFNLAHAQEGQVIDKVVAVVGEQIIMLSDIERQIVQLESESRSKLPEDIDCQILEELLFQRLLLHQAEVDSVEVSEAQVVGELDRRLRYFIGLFNGDEKKLEAEYGKTVAEIREEFYDQIEDQLKSQQVQMEITADIKMTPREVKEYFKKQPKDSLPLIDAQIEIAHLVRYAEISTVQKEELRKRMVDWKNEIKEGVVSFSTKAIFESEDPGSASKGGDLGWVSRGTFVPEFEAIAFSIPVGQISDPFETQFGMHMLEVLQRRGDQVHCRHILRKFKVGTKELINIRNETDSIYNLITSDSIDFYSAIHRFSQDKDTKNAKGVVYNPQTGERKWRMDEIDPYTFAGIENLKVGELSGPSLYEEERSGKQAYRLIKLLSKSDPHKANLKQDYQMIQQMAKGEKEQLAVNNWVKQKIALSFIRIDEDYQSCDFRFNWTNAAD